ncbi:UNVERIFIED_CONTAM: hypothetical protein Sindi_0995800 [Sesamum indicum]
MSFLKLMRTAPGPDGYSFGFYKAAWLVVGQEVTKAVLDLFSMGKLLKQINCTLLALIPKLFDFPEAFNGWIMEFVTSASFSVSINRKPHRFFVGARGLRQEDPLSPYLFVLVMEVLRIGFLQLIEQDMRFTFHWKCETSWVFQLGFADDLLLFFRQTLSRSAPGCEGGNPRRAGILGGSSPDKTNEHINGWDGLALSYAGRVQIIKSVLMALSVYWGSAFILPKGIIKEIEKRLRNFQLKGMGNSGYAKVAWKEVCKLKDEGGQGLRDIDTLNRALMCKKLCEVIRPWGWRKLLRLRHWLRSVVEYRIGDGSTFYLWKDPWHHLGALINKFSLGPITMGLDASIPLCSVIHDGQWYWLMITDREYLEITLMLPQIFGGDDRIVWRFPRSSPTTQDIYLLIMSPGSKVGWTSLLSGSLKIPRHMFILWLAILEKLATTDKPWLSHLCNCVLCNEDMVESHTHLFFRCRYNRRCISSIRQLTRFPWPNRDWARDIDWGTKKWRGKHIINVAYRALLGSCIYHIWKERNMRKFEHEERLPSTLARLIVEDIRYRIISIELASFVRTRALYRQWRISWPIENSA